MCALEELGIQPSFCIRPASAIRNCLPLNLNHGAPSTRDIRAKCARSVEQKATITHQTGSPPSARERQKARCSLFSLHASCSAKLKRNKLLSTQPSTIRKQSALVIAAAATDGDIRKEEPTHIHTHTSRVCEEPQLIYEATVKRRRRDPACTSAQPLSRGPELTH